MRSLLPRECKQHFDQLGYAVVGGLFSTEEAAFYRDYYTEMVETGRGQDPDTEIASPEASDPLLTYARMLQMHRWDEVSLKWLLEPRFKECLTDLVGREPYAVHVMIYFKPPQARGQAFHQDNYYLRVQPGTCIAAWMALDACDEANGCLEVVPGSHEWPILCTVEADTRLSFTDVMVPLPEGTKVVPVGMQPGDVLFFHGRLVHGSFPNTTKDRFRRSLIAHYIEGDSTEVARYYHPTLRFDGSVVDVGIGANGGPCGLWVSEDGKPRVELSGCEIVEKQTE